MQLELDYYSRPLSMVTLAECMEARLLLLSDAHSVAFPLPVSQVDIESEITENTKADNTESMRNNISLFFSLVS